ncbi:MAG: amidohydrolase [Rhodothalassiaceae bacterium]
MKASSLIFLLVLLLAGLPASAADLVLYNGRVVTLEDDQPQASAVAVADGRIVYVGDDAGALALSRPDSVVIDLEGRTLLPGFVDAHAHLRGIGERELTLNLEDARSIADLKARLAAWLAAHPEGPVTGRGWIETHWPDRRFPGRADLDAVAPDRPVMLFRADGHAAVVNSAALKAAGIGPGTEDPFGGEIVRTEDGEAYGVLIDAAMELAAPVFAGSEGPQRAEAYRVADRVYRQRGWTGIHNMSVAPADVPLIERLSDQGEIALRVYNSIDREGAENLLGSGPRRSANGRVMTRAVKLYMDGALGSLGAALLEPYADHDGAGLVMMREDETLPFLIWALGHGVQINTHAIGDRGNRIVLDWYERAMKAVPPSARAIAEPRWRIEHAQVLDPADIPRFAALGVIPSMQPSHAIGDLFFAPSRLGRDRLSGAYAWKSLLETGVIIACGSDAPVEKGDPLIEFYAAVARMSLDGYSDENWHQEQAVDRMTALRMLTLWPAVASFAEDDLGSIRVGKQADFSLFSVDPLTVPVAEIPKGHALLTVIGGEIVWRAEGF